MINLPLRKGLEPFQFSGFPGDSDGKESAAMRETRV